MTICFVKTESALKMKKGGLSGSTHPGSTVEPVGNKPQHAHVRRVGRPMLFLRAKRTPGDGVIN